MRFKRAAAVYIRYFQRRRFHKAFTARAGSLCKGVGRLGHHRPNVLLRAFFHFQRHNLPAPLHAFVFIFKNGAAKEPGYKKADGDRRRNRFFDKLHDRGASDHFESRHLSGLRPVLQHPWSGARHICVYRAQKGSRIPRVQTRGQKTKKNEQIKSCKRAPLSGALFLRKISKLLGFIMNHK